MKIKICKRNLRIMKNTGRKYKMSGNKTNKYK